MARPEVSPTTGGTARRVSGRGRDESAPVGAWTPVVARVVVRLVTLVLCAVSPGGDRHRIRAANDRACIMLRALMALPHIRVPPGGGDDHATMIAARRRLATRVTCHSFRHSVGTYLLESGADIPTVQELLGHDDVRTTMQYMHVLNGGALGVRRPADRL